MTPDLLRNLAAFAVQAALITAAAAVLLPSLRIASAGTRYACWRVVLAVCLTMPLLLHRPAGGFSPATMLDVATVPDLSMADFAAGPVVPDVPPAHQVSWTGIVTAVLLTGALARVCWLLAGLVRLRAFRRRGVVVDDAEVTAIQETLGTQATVRSVAGLTQPATFGFRRPVVLLPEALRDAPPAFRRAVVTHELFHVQRRDWVWVLSEEILRSALWFHPAILWLTARIQLAREELVDELTVLATADRKAYIQALLAFADAGRVHPAPAFARRRQLFTRIVRLSKEGVMSSSRIVISASAAIAVVLGTGWLASQVFPILSAAAAPTYAQSADTAVAAPQQSPSSGQSNRQTWDAYVQETQASLKVLSGSTDIRTAAQGARSGGAPRPGPTPVAAPPVGTKPITPENPIPRRLSYATVQYPSQLAGTGLGATLILRVILDASGTIADVQAVTAEVSGGEPDVRARAADAFFSSAAAAVRQWRYQSPADPPIAFFVRVTFEEGRDGIATQAEFAPAPSVPYTATVVFPWNTGNFSTDQVPEAARRVELLRSQRDAAAARYGPQDQRVLETTKQIQELERQLERVRELRQRAEADTLTTTAAAPGVARSGGPGALAQSPLVSPSGTTPVRVGGNIRPPEKTTHVTPIYPEVAKSARVQGVVILETLIDEQGRVADARILRSIPLLDQAALDAVRQWEFTPTLLNGVPVPVVMTVTVQFTLPPV